MPTRRNTAAGLVATALLLRRRDARAAIDHSVLMLNAAPDNPGHTNVFAPDLLHIAPGDTVTFIPSDKGHNAASKRGMIPEGAESWNSPMDEEFSVSLSVPGIYGYVCVPHYEMGMVGLIVVGDDRHNLEAARAVRHPGSARGVFRDLLGRLA